MAGCEAKTADMTIEPGERKPFSTASEYVPPSSALVGLPSVSPLKSAGTSVLAASSSATFVLLPGKLSFQRKPDHIPTFALWMRAAGGGVGRGASR